MSDTGRRIVQLMGWLDKANAGMDPGAVDWLRIAKISEEIGEVCRAYIGAAGANPRKGVTHDMDDVRSELLDVALTALVAYERFTLDSGSTDLALNRHIAAVCERAGLPAIGANAS